MSKRLPQLLALLLTLGLFAAACGDDDGGELGLVTSGTLTVCTDVPYPPMEFEDPSAEGGFTGFDIELMRAIADDLGLGLAVATPGWDAITSGLATEAARAVLDYAFYVLPIELVEARADARNVGSWRVMEKLGMRRSALLEGARTDRAGAQVDEVHYTIQRTRWLS